MTNQMAPPDGALLGTAKRIVPTPAKLGAKSLLRGYGRLTSPLRGLPDYLIIGSKRCGTTSLHNYLLSHPDVAPAFPAAAHVKGVHYFDRHPTRSVAWYRSFFPVGRRATGRRLVGEASPYYLIHPLAAERAAAVVPTAKIVLLVREPAERAYSHYRDELRLGNETLPFADAVAAESDRVAGELEAMAADPGYYSHRHEHFSYLGYGRYAEHLARWLSCFPAGQVLVVRSEDVFARPVDALRTVTDFLGLAPHPSVTYRHYNGTRREERDTETLSRLREYFRPGNAALRRLRPDLPDWDETDAAAPDTAAQ